MDNCKIKFKIALGILLGGMVAALAFHAFQGWVLGRGHPYDSFLSTFNSFTDFSDELISATLPNVYVDPKVNYLPFTYVCLRWVNVFPEILVVMAFLYVSLGGLVLMLIKMLEGIVANPWLRVGAALLLVLLPYPVLYCIDRGNTEIFLGTCVGCAFFGYRYGHYLLGTLVLLIAAACKPFLLFFLIFLVRQRKWGVILAGLGVFFVVTFLSAWYVSGNLRDFWTYYSMNQKHITTVACYENSYLADSASLWLTYKIGVVTAMDMGILPPVDFDMDGAFITRSYAFYVAGALLVASYLFIYVCLLEKEYLRCVVPCLLFIAVAVPTSADYRMVYTCLALAVFMRVKTYRPGDYWACVLMALVLIPKKYYYQAILNPPLMLAAIVILLYSGWRSRDPAWARLRLQLFLRSIPWMGPVLAPVLAGNKA
jgi:hypothetical protein